MTLREIRSAYERNYRLMVETIMEMGGEKKIAEHREKKTSLFRKLRQLQRTEHQLSDMEESIQIE
jgi:hypothetical protein